MNSSKTKIVPLMALALSGAIVFLSLAWTNTSRSTSAGNRAKPESLGAADSATRIREAYGKLPLAFEQTRGQAKEATNFRARGAGYTLSLSATEATFLLARGPDESSTGLRMNVVGGNRGAAVEGLNELEGKVNYLIGNDPALWRTDIPTFGRVRYREVYPGIDLVYYGNQRRLEYDFVVAPGSDPGAIVLEFGSAPKIEVESATGDLLLGIGEKTFRQRKPIVYQETSAGRREVEGRYALRNGGQVGFEVGEYDKSAALIIDPVLEYSTFLGGNGGDEAHSIAVDSAGNAYVAGFTDSTDFPIANAIQGVKRGTFAVFVTKLNAAGSALVYSTYLGGSNSDLGFAIAVDSTGSAYVTGTTFSSDFPTVNALQTMNASGNSSFGDAFVAKLNPAGSALVYSTYLGGSDPEQANGIAVDAAGNAYVTGLTRSTNFPTANALQATNAGNYDAFVTKLNAAGTALVYSTYLGGDKGDFGGSITVDSAGNAYVTGSTVSTTFPTVNAIQSTLAGSGDLSDAFVTKFNAAGSALVYSTYLGGSSYDSGSSIAVDSNRNVYVTGTTNSTNFPTANALQPANGGNDDTFVAKLNPAGSALVYSTYLGGSEHDHGNGIVVDSAGNAYVTGFTLSANFPTAHAIQSTFGGATFSGDAFVTKFNVAGSGFVYSTYLGGDNLDWGLDIALDSASNAYVTGITSSKCFPTTTGAFDTALSLGAGDAFISKISETAPPSALVPCPSELLNLATRLRVLSGDSALIGGFIIGGNQPKSMIIRGIGPSLTGLQGVLADPVLELFDSNQVLLASNDDWKSHQAEVEATTIPPANDLESAIVITLAPGAYTAVLRGQNDGIGIGVVELYDLQAAGSDSTLSNIGSRGLVDTGDNAMIGGFIVGAGNSGTRVLIRGIGPSLSSFVSGALANPTLELRNADGSLIRENDNWRDSQEMEIQATGIPPTNNLESAIVASLGNGNYTAILRGKNNTTGVGVVEVYNVP